MDRIDDHSLDLKNRFGIPVKLFANPDVKIERVAVDELNGFLELQETVDRLQEVDRDFFADADPGITQVAVTPDFHKGAGIPIGTVTRTKGFIAPQAIGKDINCGMRLMVTDWSETEINEVLPKLEQRIRHVFFEGGRQISIDRVQKEALLKNGLEGLLETSGRRGEEGLWRYYHQDEQERDLERVMDRGSLPTKGIFSGLDNYVNHEHVAFDSQLGSIGGGNHFVEVQRVKEILDAPTAYEWGLKRGAIVVMIHTGSVSVGYPASGYINEILREIYPSQLRYPENRIFPLPVGGKYDLQWQQFQMALHNAANFAFANRLFLSLMLRRVFEEMLGDREMKLLYDSGHNLLWEEEIGGEQYFLHRKGACSARGPEAMQGTPFYWTGEPALIPGSMGASSFILAGRGHAGSMASASHGAGRAMSRGRSMQQDQKVFQDFMDRFRIVTPIDPMNHQLRGRGDILKKWEDAIKQEAPWAFKAVQPIIRTQVDAEMVRTVVETEPILTVKG